MFRKLKFYLITLQAKLEAFIKTFSSLARNMYRFTRYSATFSLKSNEEELILGRITAHYHAIEKGLSMVEFRPLFGARHIDALDYYLKRLAVSKSRLNGTTHLVAAISCLKSYIEKHEGIDADFDLNRVKSIYASQCQQYSSIISNHQLHSSTFELEDASSIDAIGFEKVARSRKSVRFYTDQVVGRDVVEDIVSLSLTAPSVCNRQSVRIYSTSDKDVINSLMSMQRGNTGFGHAVKNVVVIFSELKLFEGAQEVNQPFIDGGLFSMNLMYAAEHYGVSTCPLMWPAQDIKGIKELLGTPASWEPIMLFSLGYKKADVVIPMSRRIRLNECLRFDHD